MSRVFRAASLIARCGALTGLLATPACGGAEGGTSGTTTVGGGGRPGSADPPPEPESPLTGPIMDRDAWSVAPRDVDPFAGTSTFDCGTTGYRLDIEAGQATDENPEGKLPEISTAACNSVTVTQPALRDISPGERISASVFRFRANAPVEADAVISVRIGDDVVLDDTVPIDVPFPSEDCPPNATGGFCHGSGVSEGALTVTEAIPAGTPLFFHVHNHGANLYWLLTLAAE